MNQPVTSLLPVLRLAPQPVTVVDNRVISPERYALRHEGLVTQLIISAPLPELRLVTPVVRKVTSPPSAPRAPLLAVPVLLEVAVVVNATDAASPATSYVTSSLLTACNRYLIQRTDMLSGSNVPRVR